MKKSQCSFCRHLTVPVGEVATCTAFPDGIPDDVRDTTRDHRVPLPDDNDVQWEPLTPEDVHPLV